MKNTELLTLAAKGLFDNIPEMFRGEFAETEDEVAPLRPDTSLLPTAVDAIFGLSASET